MPCAGIHQLTGVESEHRAECCRAVGAGQAGGETVQPGQRGTGTGLLEQQRTAGTAKLTHYGRGGQAVAHAVADDQRHPTLVQIDDVIPIAADLQWAARGVIPHRKAPGQRCRAEHRVLQRHGGLALLVQLVDAVQPLTEAPGQHREQRVILWGEGPSLSQLDPDDQHSARMSQRDTRRARLLGRRGQQVGVTQRLDPLPLRWRQVGPLGGLTGAHQLRRTGFRGGGPGKCHGQNAPGLPQPAQLLGGFAQCVVDRIGLSQLLIKGGQRGLPLDEVVLGRGVSQGADHDPASRVGISGMVDVDRDPQPVPIAVVDGNSEGALWVSQQSCERRFDLPVSLGVGVGIRPPRMGRLVGQLFGAVAENLGEPTVDLNDGAVLVADKERFLQRVHQGGAPADLMAAQPRQFDVGPHPRE